MMEYLLTKSFRARTAIAARRICRIVGDREAEAAASGLVLPVGVSADLGAAADRPVDIHVAGIAMVEAGGAIGAGSLVAAGAGGKAMAVSRRSLFQSAVDGADADTDIAVPGLLPDDVLTGVVELAAGRADRLAEAQIHAADVLRISTATTGDRLLVTWQRVFHAVGVALDGAAADGDLIPVLIVPQQT